VAVLWLARTVVMIMAAGSTGKARVHGGGRGGEGGGADQSASIRGLAVPWLTRTVVTIIAAQGEQLSTLPLSAGSPAAAPP
jgi:hypothetical protein